jgi:hypothetical protein
MTDDAFLKTLAQETAIQAAMLIGGQQQSCRR